MTAVEHPGGIDVADLLRIVRRRRFAVLACVECALLLVASYIALSSPVYEATAEVLYRPAASEGDDRTAAEIDRDLQNQLRIVESATARAAAADRLGYEASVDAVAAAGTDLVVIRAEDGSAGRAADIANAYADVFIGLTGEGREQGSASARSVLEARIADLDADLAQQTGASEQRRAAWIARRDEYDRRLAEMELEADIAATAGGGRIVSAAVAPSAPARPDIPRSVAIGALAGLIIGLAVALLREQADDTVRDAADLARVPGLVALGAIPRTPEPALISGRDSPLLLERFRSMRTLLEAQARSRPLDVLQVTSPVSTEWVPAVVANLAVVTAQSGRRVVVVDADLHRPTLGRLFGLPDADGLGSLLTSTDPVADALLAVPGEPGLSVLAAGGPTPHASDVLASKRCAEIVDELRQLAELVLVITPGVLDVTDALVVSRHVDGCVVVATAGSTTRTDLARAVELLRTVDAPVVGAVAIEGPLTRRQRALVAPR